MIDLTHIGDFSPSYYFFNLYLKQFHNRFYYRNVYVEGRENLVEKGKPVMIIANHQNGANDALNILYMFDDHRQPVFIARGDIFKKDSVAKILRYLKILPTFRSRDGGVSDVKFNMTSFHIAADILAKGGTVVIYPEAQHQQGHYLGTFKKGFPRIAFTAEEEADFNLNLQIQPINIHYSDYFNARTDVVLTIGKPFTFSEFFDTYKTDPNIAYQQLNAKARARLKAITPDNELHEEFDDEIELLRTMWTTARLEKKEICPNYFPYRQPEEVQTVQTIVDLKEKNPDKFAHLMQVTRAYLDELTKLNFRDWIVGQDVTAWTVISNTLLGLIALPFALFGFITNILPFEFPAYLRRKIKDRHLHASFNLVGAIASFTIYYPLVFIIIWIASKSFIRALSFILLMFLTFFVFYGCKRGWPKLVAYWRYFKLSRAGATKNLENLKNEILNMVE